MSSTMQPDRSTAAARLTLSAVALGLTALLGACSSLAPSYQRPAAPVPAQFDAAASAPAAAASAVPHPLAWTELVRDERLRRLVEQALKANRDLRVAALNVQRAQAQLGLAQADRWPTVNGVASAARAPNSQGKQTNTFQLGVQVSGWELDFFGRLQSLDDAARASLLATEAGRRSAELALVASVLTAERTLAADQALLALAERTATSRADTLRLTQLRFDRGAASQLERASAQSLTAQAEATLSQLRRQVAQDRNALALLIGAAPSADLLPQPSLPNPADAAAVPTLPDPFAPVPAALESSVLLRRPDIVQAEQQLIAANANIGAARAAFFPRISLTTSAGLVSNELSTLLQAGSFAWTLSSQALLTLFDHGRNQANLEVAKVNREIAVAQYEKALQSAFRDTSDALAGQATWQDQLTALQRQRDAARDIARLTRLRYDQGAASELERLDAERSLFSAEQALVQARLAEQLNRVGLWKALGG
jgi:NodT family efflux transporter outer membrane factor (OMF) lipoprotein